MAWNVMEQLNKNAQKAAVGDETPKARFRTKDISIKKAIQQRQELLFSHRH